MNYLIIVNIGKLDFLPFPSVGDLLGLWTFLPILFVLLGSLRNASSK